jgi:DNA-directed RNA polymerase beta' subunit
MGVLGPGSICPTDGLTYIQTPGYFGYIEMARPVFFIQHIKEIMKILKCVCFKCSKLLISKEQHTQVYQMNSYHRWDYVYPLCQKVKRCGELTENGCGCKQPDKIKLDGMSTINAIWENLVNEGVNSAAVTESKDGKSNYTMKLTAEIVLKIFKRISDEDVEFMGFSATWSRPDWMICQVLPVAPPAVRPSVKMDANQRSEDDLTHIYGHIIKTNKDLMERINANASQYIIDNLTMVLQYFVAMIVNNKVKGAVPVAHRTGRPLQCITGRLNSKNGRIRGNLMGKRVDFSARSVITGDPNLSARQLGVPLRVAMCLTKPVVVNDRNRNFLIKLVQNGPEVYPGAKILEKKDGSNVSLRYVDRTSIRLENGDIVHRHMMDGDAVLFNRQPSLHRMSMMCHIVKVMKRGDTFRMNVCDTKPYNADFDGDEMNMHMPQSELSETELRNLAAIPYQIISPSSNAPIIGIFQDSMLGSYQFTRQGVEFTPRQAMNILMGYSNIDMKELRNKKKITNFDILSQITPPISLKYKTKLFDDAEDPNVSNNVLEIHNGKYIRGQADKGVFASGTKGILNRICNDFGNMACSNYIDDLQQVITEYMKTSAYSVGVSDLVSDRKTTESVLQVISSKMNEVAELTDKIHLGILENNSGRTNAQEFEIQVGNILNDATSQTGKIGVKSLDESNRFVKIVKSGSKGSMLNISQMISCLGQQSVDGKRVPYGFDNRTLPHFKKFDDSPEARGFVKNSYISGLTAPELFFHAMGGRMGLIDTAVKSVTWETPIVIIDESGKPLYTEIGRWIDGKLDTNAEAVQHFDEKNMELLNVNNIYVPTTDEHGTVSWEEITAVTRHDPGTTLYEIKTLGGRSVTVTESKSLLIWNEERKGFFEMLTPEIRVGDCVPVTAELCEPPILIEKSADDALEIATNFHKGEDLNAEIILYPREFVERFIQVIETLGMSDSYDARNEQNANILAMLYNRIGFHVSLNKHIITTSCEYKTNIYKNNVVLDPIVEIVPIGVEKHPKMYDLTIPTTLNFGLANGLQVRDTSQTGYIQRRLVKGLEDLKVEYDGTVRNNMGKIIQFTYGEDGVDTTRVENQNINLVNMSIEDIYMYYDLVGLNEGENKDMLHIYTKETIKRFKTQRDKTKAKCKFYVDELIKFRDELVVNVFHFKNEDAIKAPVAFQYIIQNIQGQMNLTATSAVDITPLEFIETIEKTMLRLKSMFKVTRLFEIMFFYSLSPKELLIKKRFNTRAVALLMEHIVLAYKKSVVHPGEMVGVIAGQSIGEPTTQLTLNTFHLAGVATKSNVTRGVPRIEEILRLTRNPDKPSATVFLKPADQHDKDKAANYCNMIQHTKLVDVVKSVEICFDPNDFDTKFAGDKFAIEEFYEFEKLVEECNEGADENVPRSKWIIRIEIDAVSLLDKNITMDDIHFAISNGHKSEVSCVFSDMNSNTLLFRIRLNSSVFKKKKGAVESLDQSDEIYLLKHFQDNLLNNVVLRGVNNITNVNPRMVKDMVVKEDSKYVRKDIWLLDTVGSNLLDIFPLDFIDYTRTYSNDIREVYDVLGIEAARQNILNEFNEVMEASDAYVNYHHLSILCDRMTVKADMVPMFRSGIINDDIGPISKSTYEMHTEIFLDASRHGDFDQMRGVSANVMCGQAGFYGTNAFSLLLDMKAILQLEEKELAEQKAIDFGFVQEDDTAMKIDIDNNVRNIQSMDIGKTDDDYSLF